MMRKVSIGKKKRMRYYTVGSVSFTDSLITTLEYELQLEIDEKYKTMLRITSAIEPF